MLLECSCILNVVFGDSGVEKAIIIAACSFIAPACLKED